MRPALGGYVLEAGDYTLSIRTDSHNVIDERTITVDKDIDYSINGRSTDNEVANNQFQIMTQQFLTIQMMKCR